MAYEIEIKDPKTGQPYIVNWNSNTPPTKNDIKTILHQNASSMGIDVGGIAKEAAKFAAIPLQAAPIPTPSVS